MTANAQRVLEEIRRLPVSDLRELSRAVVELAPPLAALEAAASSDRPSSKGNDEANEASFFTGLEEARRLWGASGRDAIHLD